MRVNFGSLENEPSLMQKIEFAQLKKQIQNIACFLPNQILKMRSDEMSIVKNSVGIILFTRMYGMVELVEKYNKFGEGGIYKLTATLNAYVGAIMEALNFYGGDVVKFTGSMIITQWVMLPHNSLVDKLHEVVCCALFIQANLGHFATETSVVMQMKNAISSGNMSFYIMGTTARKHYAIVGESLDDVSSIIECALMGEVIMTYRTWAHMIQERYDISEFGTYVKVWKVVFKANEANNRLYFEEQQIQIMKVISKHIKHRKKMLDLKKLETYHTYTDLRNELSRQLPERYLVKVAPKNWALENLGSFIVKPVLNQIIESQPVEYLTQMQSLTLQYIRIKPKSYYGTYFMELLKNVFDIICMQSGRFGTILYMSRFCDYITAMVLFGLRGQSHGIEAQNSLLSSYRLHRDVRQIDNVQEVAVATSISMFYTGVIGHPLRKEFICIGTGAQRVREMVKMNPDKVTCDFKAFKNSKLPSFYFKVCKHQHDTIHGTILEYSEQFDNSVTILKSRLPMVGRFAEYNAIRSIIWSPETSGVQYYGICFYGGEELGKTAILNESYAAFSGNEGCVAVSTELEGSSKIPFYCVCKLYRLLFDLKATQYDDANVLVSLPRDMFDLVDEALNRKEDVALQKYRILNYFRIIVQFTRTCCTVIFIDNAEQLDLQSWEILEIVLFDGDIRIILAGNFEAKEYWSLRFKISNNDLMKMYELQPISPKCVPAIACQYLKVAGIPKRIISLLLKTCEGRAGYIKNCLLRLVNTGHIELKLINRLGKDHHLYFYPHSRYTGYTGCGVIPVVKYTKMMDSSLEASLTMDAISLDLVDSFTPFEQLVIKTASVLGNMFTRMLLIIALKIPPETTFSLVIYRLFQAEVFECGGRYMYANDNIDSSILCCSCYFEDGYFNPKSERFLPRYSYCKILHFKNRNLREVAYRTVPQNQREELHLLCTDILENMEHKCPTCFLNPLNNIFRLGKFKDVMTYCNNLEMAYSTSLQKLEAAEIKETLRNIFRCLPRGGSPIPSQGLRGKSARPFYNPANCNCLEILLRVYTDLMYHSERSGHLAKQIYFTLHYGSLLMNVRDFSTSIDFLSKARELCLINSKLDNVTISETFRKLHVGQIEIALANACIELRQLNAARNHLAIALRQYNIPTLALSYRLYRPYLTRRFLICNMRNSKIPYKNVIARCDMAKCMALCSNLFYMEGDWAMAKLTATYSIFLIKSVNPNVQMLLDIYCTAIDTHRYLIDSHLGEKLVKSIVTEVMQNYCFDHIYTGYYISTLLGEVLKCQMASGDVVKSIRVGYRVIEINQILLSTDNYIEVIATLAILLASNYRINEAVALTELLQLTKTSHLLSYLKIITYIYLGTTFLVEPLSILIQFCEDFLLSKPPNIGWEEYHFMAMVRLLYLRQEKYEDANRWEFSVYFTTRNIRRNDVFHTLLLYTEGSILLYLHSLRMQALTLLIEEQAINIRFKLMRKGLIVYRVYEPMYLCLLAWFKMIKKKKWQGFRLLERARRTAEKQKNLMVLCLAMQLKNAWTGGYSIKFGETPENSYLNTDNITLTKWAHLMPALPLE